MAKSKTTDAGTPAAKKTRTRRPQAFIGRVTGSDNPVIIIAGSHKAALAALVKFGPAQQQDLIDAGKNDWTVIDATAVKSNVTNITEAA